MHRNFGWSSTNAYRYGLGRALAVFREESGVRTQFESPAGYRNHCGGRRVLIIRTIAVLCSFGIRTFPPWVFPLERSASAVAGCGIALRVGFAALVPSIARAIGCSSQKFYLIRCGPNGVQLDNRVRI